MLYSESKIKYLVLLRVKVIICTVEWGNTNPNPRKFKMKLEIVPKDFKCFFYSLKVV
jgi:hypothetical protein